MSAGDTSSVLPEAHSSILTDTLAKRDELRASIGEFLSYLQYARSSGDHLLEKHGYDNPEYQDTCKLN
eukprot:8642695-Prorocentrum_lima.AAC.1